MKKLRIMLVAALAALVLTVGAFADNSGIVSTVGSALSTVQTDAMTMISTVLPYALAIVGAVLVITVGIRVFKKISGR